MKRNIGNNGFPFVLQLAERTSSMGKNLSTAKADAPTRSALMTPMGKTCPGIRIRETILHRMRKPAPGYSRCRY